MGCQRGTVLYKHLGNICGPRMITNNTIFHSQKFSSLDDRLYDYSRYRTIIIQKSGFTPTETESMTGGGLRSVGLQSETRLWFPTVIELTRNGNGHNRLFHSGVVLRKCPRTKWLFSPRTLYSPQDNRLHTCPGKLKFSG